MAKRRAIQRERGKGSFRNKMTKVASSLLATSSL